MTIKSLEGQKRGRILSVVFELYCRSLCCADKMHCTNLFFCRRLYWYI